MYLMDTDICIYIRNRRPPEVYRRFRGLVPGDIGISSITLAELQFGVEKSSDPARNQDALDLMLRPLDVHAFDRNASVRYGRLRAYLERNGHPIGGMDLLIAAHALQLGAVLVTNNAREFSRVPGLKTENWIRR